MKWISLYKNLVNKTSMIVDCQNRITQVEITTRNSDTKSKQEMTKINSSLEILKLKVETIEKEFTTAKEIQDTIIENVKNHASKIDQVKDQNIELSLKTKHEVNDLILRTRRDIQEIRETTKLQDSSIETYRANLTKYDIIVSDSKYKLDNIMKLVSRFDAEKANTQEIIPRMVRMDREIASLRVALKKASHDTVATYDKDTDIYLQNEPTSSLANDSIRIFVKLVTLIAKTVANEEQLEILQKFVKEKNEAFDKMELQNLDPQMREKEAIEKAMLLSKLEEILNYKLKPYKIKVKRNRLNSWQSDFDPGIVKSSKSNIGRSDSTKINRYLK